MTDQGKMCGTCFWFSDGYQAKDAGFCYSESDYVSPDSYCAFWEHSNTRYDAATGEKLEALDFKRPEVED